MNLLPLAKHIEDLGLGTRGLDVFVHVMPDTAHNATLLRAPIPTLVNSELPGYFKARFQVIVRSVDVDPGLAKIKSIVSAITLEGVVIDTQTFNFCRPMFLPQTYPIDSGAYFEHVVGFEACFVEA